jgi:hypothetical protein
MILIFGVWWDRLLHSQHRSRKVLSELPVPFSAWSRLIPSLFAGCSIKRLIFYLSTCSSLISASCESPKTPGYFLVCSLLAFGLGALRMTPIFQRTYCLCTGPLRRSPLSGNDSLLWNFSFKQRRWVFKLSFPTAHVYEMCIKLPLKSYPYAISSRPLFSKSKLLERFCPHSGPLFTSKFFK